jgi:hypothetical protein
MRKKKSTKRKHVIGGAVMTRRPVGSRSSGRQSMGHLSSSRRSASASMSKKMVSVSKYVTILNKLVKSKSVKKTDPNAGYILIPFVDSYSRESHSGRRIATLRGGAGPARAASIADEPEADAHLARNIIELLRRHGRTVLGFHGPCWWHRINHYERLVSMTRCNPDLATQLRRNAVIDFLCSLPAARGSRPRAEACMQAADDDQDLAFRYIQEGIPEPARAAAASRPPRVALTLPPECVGQVYVSRGSRFEYTNPPGELERAMNYFAAQYQGYCQLVDNAVPDGLTGARLTGIIRGAFDRASDLDTATEQFRIPAHFDSPDTRLTFCEYAAIFFFTRDCTNTNTPFSSFQLLNNTIDYRSVKDLAAAEYVQRIRHPFVMLFYFALYKCPRVRDIRRANLTPPGMRHLHRFMPVTAEFFQAYRVLPVQSLVTFYCFQSFSFTLAYQNIQPFTNPVLEQNKFHVVLLRLEITDATSARLMSHFSELIQENEAIVTPCVPYTVVNIQEFQSSAGFEQEITAGSGYIHPQSFNAEIRGFLVVTIREEKYKESLTGLVPAVRG